VWGERGGTPLSAGRLEGLLGCQQAARGWFLWLPVPAFGSEAPMQFQCDLLVLEGAAR